MAYRTQMQQIAAGSQFDGTAPTGTKTSATGKVSFPEAATGGLFDIGPVDPGHVMGISLYAAGAGDLAGAAQTWTISKITAEGDEHKLFSGTTETEFVMHANQRFLMLPKEKIKVVTTGMTAAMRCSVSTDFDLTGGSDG